MMTLVILLVIVMVYLTSNRMIRKLENEMLPGMPLVILGKTVIGIQ